MQVICECDRDIFTSNINLVVDRVTMTCTTNAAKQGKSRESITQLKFYIFQSLLMHSFVWVVEFHVHSTIENNSIKMQTIPMIIDIQAQRA